MNVNNYFDPVSLEKPGIFLLKKEDSFAHQIKIHTSSAPIEGIENHDVAIIGIPENRNTLNNDTDKAPDIIRGNLYQLASNSTKLKIYDLGNIKISKTINDTFYAIRDVLNELFNHNIFPVLIGGAQNITYGAYMAYKNMSGINFVTIDPTIDAKEKTDDISSGNYLTHIFEDKTQSIHYSNIGHQLCLTPEKSIDVLNKKYFEAYRLGMVRNNIKRIEPVLRDADIVSLDIASVRHADAPGNIKASPNGFHAEEICQIARYAGISDHLSCFGIFETNPHYDINGQTAHLCAQIIWYFLDGFIHRRPEYPGRNDNNFKKFMMQVSHKNNSKIVFYKSLITDRWWFAIPCEKKDKDLIVACSYEDYLTAANDEIPSRWLWFYNKYN
jgi:formiminoglutamase